MTLKKVSVMTVILTFLFISPAYSYSNFIQEINGDIPKKRSYSLSNYIHKLSEKYDISSDLIVAMVWQETTFRNTDSDVDINPKSCGYMQISTWTAESITGEQFTCRELILRWKYTLELSVRYLDYKIEETGSVAGGIQKYNGINNLSYVRDVLNKLTAVRRAKEGKND